jgi:hypothetical protein
MPMTDRAKTRAKEKRQKLKAIRDQREAAQEKAALSLLNDDAEGLAVAKAALIDLDIQEKQLTQVKGRWEQKPDGRWVREIVINDDYTIMAKVETVEATTWLQGTAVMKYQGSEFVSAGATGIDYDAVKGYLDKMIGGMRAIVREATSPAAPGSGTPQS